MCHNYHWDITTIKNQIRTWLSLDLLSEFHGRHDCSCRAVMWNSFFEFPKVSTDGQAEKSEAEVGPPKNLDMVDEPEN